MGQPFFPSLGLSFPRGGGGWSFCGSGPQKRRSPHPKHHLPASAKPLSPAPSRRQGRSKPARGGKGELDTSLVFLSLLSHFQLHVNKEGKKCQFLLGAVFEESSLNPSRPHCSSVSPPPGAAQSASDVSLTTPHSYTESHSSGSGKDIL